MTSVYSPPPDASLTQRGFVSDGDQEVKGRKTMKSGYSQTSPFGVLELLLESFGVAVGFPENWDVGDAGTYGSSDPWPEGLADFRLTVPAAAPPYFEQRVLSLGFSGDNSFFDIDSYTAGGLRVRKDFTDEEITTELRAMSFDGVYNSRVVLNSNNVQIAAESLLLPTIDELSVININGQPYIAPVVGSVVSANGLDLDYTGALSFNVNTGSWGTDSISSSLTTASMTFQDFLSSFASGSIDSAGASSVYLASVNTNVVNASGTDEIVAIGFSVDGGATWTTLGEFPAPDAATTGLSLCVPVSIPTGVYTFTQLRLGVRVLGGSTLNFGAGATSRFNIFPVT